MSLLVLQIVLEPIFVSCIIYLYLAKLEVSRYVARIAGIDKTCGTIGERKR